MQILPPYGDYFRPPIAQRESLPLSDAAQYINPDIHGSQGANGGLNGGLYQRKHHRPDTYKTVMCQSWLEVGTCAFGENCRFAHGEHELRPMRLPIRNMSKYKTKLCDKYTTTGICPFGNRCLFIHPPPRAHAPAAHATLSEARPTMGRRSSFNAMPEYGHSPPSYTRPKKSLFSMRSLEEDFTSFPPPPDIPWSRHRSSRGSPVSSDDSDSSLTSFVTGAWQWHSPTRSGEQRSEPLYGTGCPPVWSNGGGRATEVNGFFDETTLSDDGRDHLARTLAKLEL